MEGKPRTRRRYSQYTNCPLPTAEDRLLFILSYLKVAALQVAHATMFGMSQSNANKWIHVLLPVLYQTLIALGDLLGIVPQRIEFAGDRLHGRQFGISIAFLDDQLAAYFSGIQPGVEPLGAKLRIGLALAINTGGQIDQQIGQMIFGTLAAAGRPAQCWRCCWRARVSRWPWQFKGIFDAHSQVPTKGLVTPRRFALGAVFVYQLTLWYRYEHGLDLSVGLKPVLKAA